MVSLVSLSDGLEIEIINSNPAFDTREVCPVRSRSIADIHVTISDCFIPIEAVTIRFKIVLISCRSSIDAILLEWRHHGV